MICAASYTGETLHEYRIKVRLQKAVQLLRTGQSEQQAAEQCGFRDSFGLIRSCKRVVPMPPRRYMDGEERRLPDGE